MPAEWKRWNESEVQRKREVYFGIITALTEERRVRPLTSLHQALILSLSTPGSNFTSTPCIPSSLPLSLQGSLSSLSCYFITSSPLSDAISFFTSLTPSFLSKRNTPLVFQPSLFIFFHFFTLFISLPLSPFFHFPKLLAFLCVALVMQRWREGEVKGVGLGEWNIKREKIKGRQTYGDGESEGQVWQRLQTIDQHHGFFPLLPKNTYTSILVMDIRGWPTRSP